MNRVLVWLCREIRDAYSFVLLRLEGRGRGS